MKVILPIWIITFVFCFLPVFGEEEGEVQKEFWPEHDVPELTEELEGQFKVGISLYEAEDYLEALRVFAKIQREFAHHSPSLAYWNACVLKINDVKTKNYRESKALELIQFPAVKFENASLDEIFEYLTVRVGEMTKGEFALNIVFDGTEQQRQNTTVSFELSRGRLEDLIRYIVQLSRCRSSVEPYALKVSPIG